MNNFLPRDVGLNELLEKKLCNVCRLGKCEEYCQVFIELRAQLIDVLLGEVFDECHEVMVSEWRYGQGGGGRGKIF